MQLRERIRGLRTSRGFLRRSRYYHEMWKSVLSTQSQDARNRVRATAVRERRVVCRGNVRAKAARPARCQGNDARKKSCGDCRSQGDAVFYCLRLQGLEMSHGHALRYLCNEPPSSRRDREGCAHHPTRTYSETTRGTDHGTGMSTNGRSRSSKFRKSRSKARTRRIN